MGAIGPAGPAGPAASRADILAAVDDQFTDIRKRLDIQLVRIAQLQQELDATRKETAHVRHDLSQVHASLKELLRI